MFPELTKDVLDNDAILFYINRQNGRYSPLPGISINDIIEVELLENQVRLFFYNKNTGNSIIPPLGEHDLLKVIIIKKSESINTTSKKNNSKNIFGTLKSMNININDYHAVCDYYNIKY